MAFSQRCIEHRLALSTVKGQVSALALFFKRPLATHCLICIFVQGVRRATSCAFSDAIVEPEPGSLTDTASTLSLFFFMYCFVTNWLAYSREGGLYQLELPIGSAVFFFCLLSHSCRWLYKPMVKNEEKLCLSMNSGKRILRRVTNNPIISN